MRPTVFAFAIAIASTAAPLFAQAPPPEPHKIVALAASGGLAVTSGNSDTSTVNVGYDVTYDPETRNIVKSDGLYLRGKNAGVLASNRLALNVRDQFKLGRRAYVFGQNQYMRDTFKNIDYLVAPTGGVGYKVIDTPMTQFDADAGLGGVWEKNPNADVRTSGAVTANEKLVQKLTATTTLTHSLAALWKTSAFDDSLYNIGVGISAAMSTRMQLKVEVLDTFKNKPPVPGVKKNDVATIIAVVYKM